MLKTSANHSKSISSVLCPSTSSLKANVITCPGVLVEGKTLAYACSMCLAYKRYAQDKFPNK